MITHYIIRKKQSNYFTITSYHSFSDLKYVLYLYTFLKRELSSSKHEIPEKKSRKIFEKKRKCLKNPF